MAPLPKPDDFALDMEALRPRVYSRDWNTLVRRQSVSDLKVCILIEIKTRYPSTSRLNDKVEITCQFVKIYWSTPHPEDTFNTRRYRGGSHALSGSRAGIGTEATWWIIWGTTRYVRVFVYSLFAYIDFLLKLSFHLFHNTIIGPPHERLE